MSHFLAATKSEPSTLQNVAGVIVLLVIVLVGAFFIWDTWTSQTRPRDFRGDSFLPCMILIGFFVTMLVGGLQSLLQPWPTAMALAGLIPPLALAVMAIALWTDLCPPLSRLLRPRWWDASRKGEAPPPGAARGTATSVKLLRSGRPVRIDAPEAWGYPRRTANGLSARYGLRGGWSRGPNPTAETVTLYRLAFDDASFADWLSRDTTSQLNSHPGWVLIDLDAAPDPTTHLGRRTFSYVDARGDGRTQCDYFLPHGSDVAVLCLDCPDQDFATRHAELVTVAGTMTLRLEAAR